MKALLLKAFLFSVLVGVAVAASRNEDIPSRSKAKNGSKTVKQRRAGISDTTRRLREAADNYDNGVQMGLQGATVCPAYSIYCGLKGSANAAKHVGKSFDDGEYHKTAGYVGLTVARPVAGVIAAPVGLLTGLVTAASGPVAAAGSLAKIGYDRAKSIARGKQSEEQKVVSRLNNAVKANEHYIKGTKRYEKPFIAMDKAAKYIEGKPPRK